MEFEDQSQDRLTVFAICEIAMKHAMRVSSNLVFWMEPFGGACFRACAVLTQPSFEFGGKRLYDIDEML